MKTLQKLRLLFVMFLVVYSFQSCEKDNITADTIAPEEVAEQTDDSNSSSDDSNSTPDNSSNTEESTGEITLYRVDGNNLVKERDFEVSGKELEYQKDVEKHQEVWKMVKDIVPPSYLAKMSHFMIFAGEANGTAGYVYNTEENLSKWEMGIAIDFAYVGGGLNTDGELAHTIIHEFGHILTLDNTQLDASISQSDCTNYYPGEGCAKEPAYINKLYQNYWADIASEHSELGEEDYEAQEKFYEKYQNRFVTNYASTNPAEDIAEVFATFVIRNGGPNGNQIAEQKIQLMHDHSELMGLRDFIRGNTSSAKGKRFFPAVGAWKNANRFGNPKHINCVRKTSKR